MKQSEIVVDQVHLDTMVAHCLHALPNEGCGLLIGELESGRVIEVVKTDNVAKSARVYNVDPRQHLLADRAAEKAGLAIIGVFHSHTHTDPYPSPTDVAQAPDPSWHYMLISLRDELASVRSYRIIDGQISEEPVVLAGNRSSLRANLHDSS